MTKMPFASKSPKGKGSNGHADTGAMTKFKVQPKPESGRGLSAGNHPTTAASSLKRKLMKMNGMSMKDLGK